MSTEAQPSSSGPNTSGLRPWRKGQSGNPHGRRPRGLATVEKLRMALVDDLPDILKGVIESAKNGDAQSARMILDRLLPPLKAIELPAIVDGLSGTLTDQGAAVLAAMGSGTLSPGQAAQLLAALAAQAKLVEVDDFRQRLAALEKRAGIGAPNGHG